jgi:hypothetical protein
MMVMTKRTIGGTTTQNLVQKGMILPPFEFCASIGNHSWQINTKMIQTIRPKHAKPCQIQCQREKSALPLVFGLAFGRFWNIFSKNPGFVDRELLNFSGGEHGAKRSVG